MARGPVTLPTPWHGEGAPLRCEAGQVFVRTEGDIRSAPPLLLIHGFPTSSYDFSLVWGRLARKRPLVTLDLLGFGMSDKPASFGYSLFEQADVVVEVMRKLGVREAHVLGHDMGTSVTTELLARRARGILPFEVRSVTLTNGSVFVEMAHLTLAQKVLRHPRLGPTFAALSSYLFFRRTMRQIVAEPDAISEDELRTHWALMTRDQGLRRLPKIISYIDERIRYRSRWIGALERLDLPTLVLWGARDPVAVLAIGEKLAKTIPDARLRVMGDLGHYPQIEGPDVFAAEVDGFLSQLGG